MVDPILIKILQSSQNQDDEEDITNTVISQFKYCNLQIIIFHAAAYCTFKRRFDYIKYLWNFLQPNDSNVNWVNTDITPSELKDIILLYFQGVNKQSFSYRFDDHHGNKIYLDQYFLLLLLRAFSKISEQQRETTINNFILPQDLDSYDLSRINYSVDELIKLLYKKDDECLIELGFKVAEVKQVIKKSLIPFLNSLKPKVQQSLVRLVKTQKISPQKVNQFKEDFVKGFHEICQIRRMLIDWDLYESKISQKINREISLSGITTEFIDKAAFFDKWYLHYHLSQKFQEDFASSEDLEIIKQLIDNCQEITIDSFQDTLDVVAQNSQDNLFMLINFCFRSEEYSIFSKNRKNRRDIHQVNLKRPNLRSFRDWYYQQDRYIPVFEIEDKNSEDNIIILNKSKLGKLIQYSPCEEGDLENLCDIFRIKVTAFSEDNQLMNNYLNKPPDWLLQKGDFSKQKDYLEQKVLIEIDEKFEFKKHPEFEGYLIRLPKEREK